MVTKRSSITKLIIFRENRLNHTFFTHAVLSKKPYSLLCDIYTSVTFSHWKSRNTVVDCSMAVLHSIISMQVTLVKWNEPYQKLASCDSTGIIFVWIKYEGRWSIELINDRNTPVTSFSWSHDGRMALICYQVILLVFFCNLILQLFCYSLLTSTNSNSLEFKLDLQCKKKELQVIHYSLTKSFPASLFDSLLENTPEE